jgi:hypothetical protein
MLPGETPEQFRARMKDADDSLATAAALMERAAPSGFAPHGPVWTTSCAPSGMYYNCQTY